MPNTLVDIKIPHSIGPTKKSLQKMSSGHGSSVLTVNHRPFEFYKYFTLLFFTMNDIFFSSNCSSILLEASNGYSHMAKHTCTMLTFLSMQDS